MLTWIEISRPNLLRNIRSYRSLIGRKTKIMAVVKSDAYGHGASLVGPAIEASVDALAVVNLDEALMLRRNNIHKPILVLGYFPHDAVAVQKAIRQGIIFTVYDSFNVAFLAQQAKAIKKTALLQIKIDTGTSRLGVLPFDLPALLIAIKKFKRLKITGYFSHLAASEENLTYTRKQVADFKLALEKIGLVPGQSLHIACTAASALPEAQFDYLRLGIGLYGLWPSALNQQKTLRQKPGFRLKPVLSWHTSVIQIKQLPAGKPVGYGLTYRTTRPTTIAIIPVGYYEGLDRKLSNTGQVIVRGKKCPIVGRVSMNLTIIDVSRVSPRIQVGDQVTLLGQQGKTTITADDIALKVGTINYEVVARLNPLLPRILV